jgi:hypothetical protein
MKTSTLLGYLAQFGSFSAQSEVLCTQGLTYLLRTHAEAHALMAKEVEARTGVVIDDSLEWHPEKEQEDKARPDLEACTADEDEVPFVKIEAKLGAELTANQLKSYAADLRNRNKDNAALLVLVPKGRIPEAARETAKAFGQSESGQWRVTDGQPSGIAVISVISWNELFKALRGGKSERFRYELEQLEAMYRVLRGDDIAPLAGEEELRQWWERETDFHNVVDQATRKLTTRERLLPMRFEPFEPDELPKDASQEWQQGYRLRYVGPSSNNVASFYSIGVRDYSFAKWVTPIWMRFHKATGDFQDIRQRIKASEASSLRWLESGGHIWIPLDVPLDVSGEQMVQRLVEQAEEVVRVAYPAD